MGSMSLFIIISYKPGFFFSALLARQNKNSWRLRARQQGKYGCHRLCMTHDAFSQGDNEHILCRRKNLYYHFLLVLVFHSFVLGVYFLVFH